MRNRSGIFSELLISSLFIPCWLGCGDGVEFASVSPSGTEAEPSAETSPSLILISMDTLRADRLGAYGNSEGLTPNLDRFASESVLFEHVIAQSNETLFSHASLFTSRYASELGVVDYRFVFPEDVPTLSGVLELYGYRTAAMVAGGHLAPIFGLDRGFEVYEMPREWGSLYHTRRAAARWLEEDPGTEPFFLFVHGYDTHHRYLKPAPFGLSSADRDYRGAARETARLINGTAEVVDGVWYAGRIQPEILDLDALRLRTPAGQSTRISPSEGTPFWPRDLEHLVNVYDGAVRYADAQFGLFMADLEARGILDNAVIVVLSDHGEELGEYGLFNHRTWLSPETQRVPLMIRLPNGDGAGRRIAEPTALLDVMPTLLDAAGAEIPAEVRGVSWWGTITEDRSPPVSADRLAFSEGVWRVVSVSNGQEGLVFSGLSAHSPFLSSGLELASSSGPAFDLWSGTGTEQQTGFHRALLEWRARVPLSPVVESPLTEERRRILREHGYWGTP